MLTGSTSLSLESLTHIKPWCTKVDTFLLFDYVHLLRNIRNKWITEKTQELSFELNCEQMTAKW